MAKSKKKVETFQIVFTTQNSFSLLDLLTSQEILHTSRVKGKDVTFKVIENHVDYLVGIVETSRNTNIPPKKNNRLKIVEKIGLTSEEGLAYANVFILEKKRNILMYEVNKSGCYVDHFVDFIYRIFRNHQTLTAFDIKIKPVLKSNEYQRMMKMNFYKSLELEVASPEQIIKDYKHQNDALMNIFRLGTQTNASKVSTKLAVGMKNTSGGLTSSSLRTLIDHSLELVRGPFNNNMQKIIVEGYESDSDDNKLTSIDLIADRYLKHITLNEPRENSDLLEHQRSIEIKNLYHQSKNDFDAIFGK